MIQLLLADGHPSRRGELRNALGAVAGLTVVGEAGTGEELFTQLAGTTPTVLLLGLDLLPPGAFALLPTLRAQYPELRVLARGELSNEHYVARALDLGAHGYVLNAVQLPELIHAVFTVAAGRPFLCSTIGLALVGRLYARSPTAGTTARAALGLSKREMEVLDLVAQGLTNAEIAVKLFTSKRTVETHRQNIIAKTQTRNTAALIKLAARQGLLG
ncbi:LuxR C-terminal-related transcriptional regulator [Hymenobacter terricola]|uniref:LuxR C-terminal-related transcriptional regulator n=1 Tax=Hymenobacter terricola TaxID=2819236 RepID=UPI001B316045|nr:response regulator transcription factor [Hymenobacter terricola]